MRQQQQHAGHDQQQSGRPVQHLHPVHGMRSPANRPACHHTHGANVAAGRARVYCVPDLQGNRAMRRLLFILAVDRAAHRWPPAATRARWYRPRRRPAASGHAGPPAARPPAPACQRAGIRTDTCAWPSPRCTASATTSSCSTAAAADAAGSGHHPRAGRPPYRHRFRPAAQHRARPAAHDDAALRLRHLEPRRPGRRPMRQRRALRGRLAASRRPAGAGRGRSACKARPAR